MEPFFSPCGIDCAAAPASLVRPDKIEAPRGGYGDSAGTPGQPGPNATPARDGGKPGSILVPGAIHRSRRSYADVKLTRTT